MPGLTAYVHNNRQHQCGYGHIIHKGGHNTGTDHDHRYNGGFAAPRNLEDDPSNDIGHSRVGQTAAENKDRPYGDYRRVAPSGYRFSRLLTWSRLAVLAVPTSHPNTGFEPPPNSQNRLTRPTQYLDIGRR